MALQPWLQLALTDGLGPILTRRLIEATGSAESACIASAAQVRNVEGIGRVNSEKIFRSLQQSAEESKRELEKAARLGVSIICPDDELYPTLLRSIPDPPCVLYVKGSLEARDLNALAIVGSRQCSFYGREQAERFGALLAGAGLTVISGGARGIDSSAHRGAMSHPQGRTIAVLGCGIDVVYPPENQSLFEQIAQRGAVLSEYPIGTPPVAENFPRRNRIVSGMSRGVLVIEADERSGALITARQACDDHGRTVFALPGRVDNKTSNGPHQLIRDGAVITTKLEDILENLGPMPSTAFEVPEQNMVDESTTPLEEKVTVSLSEQQRAIMSGIDDNPTNIDTIIERTTIPVQVVMQELTFLSLKGVVKRVDGQHYVRRT